MHSDFLLPGSSKAILGFSILIYLLCIYGGNREIDHNVLCSFLYRLVVLVLSISLLLVADSVNITFIVQDETFFF